VIFYFDLEDLKLNVETWNRRSKTDRATSTSCVFSLAEFIVDTILPET